jgi:hypothetical protein
VAYPEIFFGARGRGVQQIQLTEGRENRNLGAVAPQSGVPPNFKMGETCNLIRFLRCIFHGTGNSARLCQNFGIISGGGGLNTPNPPSGYASVHSYLTHPSSQKNSSSCHTFTSHLRTSLFWHLTFLLIRYFAVNCSAQTSPATGVAQWYRNLSRCSKHTNDQHIPSQGAPKRTSCQKTQQIITPYQMNIKNHSLTERRVIENCNETMYYQPKTRRTCVTNLPYEHLLDTLQMKISNRYRNITNYSEKT